MKWKQIVGWTFIAIGAIVLVAVVGGYFYLQTKAFRNFAMRQIVKQADEATGGHAQIQGFDFKLSTLTAHLYGVVVRGKEPATDPPLLAVNELTVRLKILSILHHKVNLRELLIDHPVTYLQVNSKGETNLPRLPRANPTATPTSSISPSDMLD